MTFGVIDNGFEHVQHIVTETAGEYYARKRWEAEQARGRRQADIDWDKMKRTEYSTIISKINEESEWQN